MATLRKRGKSYVLDWSDADGQHRKSLGPISEREAKLRLKTKEYELASGNKVLPTGLIFQNFVEEYKSWHATAYPSSYFRIEQIIDDHLTPEFGLIPIDQITLRHIQNYLPARVEAGAKRSTILKEIRTLIAIANNALDIEEIKSHNLGRAMRKLRPFFRVVDSKPPRFYTNDEMRIIYAASGDRAHWWQFLANQGVRRTEAMQINRKRDIGSDAIRLLSNEEERTKSAKWREVPLFDGGREALERFPQDGQYLFPRMRKESLSRAAIKDIRRAGLDGSMHCFRHTFCSHLVINGWKLRDVQRMAGHAHITTTEKYVHSGTQPIMIERSRQLSL